MTTESMAAPQIDYTTLSLAKVRTALDDVARDAQATFGGLDARQLNWTPEATRWSIAQCFEHLLKANRLMVSASEEALTAGRPQRGIAATKHAALCPRTSAGTNVTLTRSRFVAKKTKFSALVSRSISQRLPVLPGVFGRMLHARTTPTVKRRIRRALNYLLSLMRFGPGPVPPGSSHDPYAWKPSPLKPRPHRRSGAVAVAEPDER